MNSDHTKKGLHVAIVGGGITGLSTAWFLQKAAQKVSLDLHYTLLERGNRWGGKVLTDEIEGSSTQPFIVEAGPDSFITQKPWALQLARQLGLEERMLPTNDQQRKVYVLNKGKPVPLPEGVLLIVPTEVMPFALSPLLSPLGKLRMALDLFIPPKRDGEDETLAEFVTRRLGAEALDKMAEPLMSGIYNAEAEKQSILATFPRFRELEMRHGSLIRGMLAARRARSTQQAPGNGEHKAPAMFVSFQDGMEEFVLELHRHLQGDCRLNTAVERIEPHEGNYQLFLTDGDCLDADAVVLTIPAYVAAQLVKPFAPDTATQLESIRYVSTGTMSLAFRASDVENPLEGFGLVIPRVEERPINAITWTSTKFDRRAPEGYVLLRVFFGGSRNPQMIDVEDDQLVAIVRRELDQLLGIQADPLFYRVYRWHRANPQYDKGHLQRVADIEDGLPQGIYVTGSPYRGIGIPDCIHQAQQTVEKLLAEWMREHALTAGAALV